MHLLLLLLLALTALEASRPCTSCNITKKREQLENHLVSRMTKEFGFDPTKGHAMTPQAKAKGALIAAQTDLMRDPTAEFGSVNIFGSDPGDDTDTARFHFGNDTKSRAIHKAELSLYLARPEDGSMDRKEVVIEVYATKADGEKGELLAAHRALSPKNTHGRHKVRLNSEAMERIAREPSALLLIEAIYNGENLVVLPGDDDADNHPMFVTLTLGAPRRAKRSLLNFCKEGDANQSCCLLRQTIRIEEIGWMNVIAPAVFDAYTCAGTCRQFTQHSSEEYEDTEVSRASMLNAAGIPASCCAPTSYESATFIYMSPYSENVITKTIEDFFPVSCGCL